MEETPPETVYKKTACCLCSINCGLEVQTGGKDDREFIKIRGDRANVSSRGYLCEKASRLNFYQNSADRLDSPLRRTPDGDYERVDWDTAISEIASNLQRVQRNHGGEKILFCGGGGQGNHLGALYSDGVLKTLGVRYRTNSLAQEKTGEFWVEEEMFGAGVSGDFQNAEVAVFLGKNPWQSHGVPQARKLLKEIAKDPHRKMIVIDPCATATARLADVHLQLKPGSDAWCLTALIGTVIQEGLEDKEFIRKHTAGYELIESHFRAIDIQEHAAICELDELTIRATARIIANAKSTSVIEDLGVQQNINSTLVSYLQRVLWIITGHFAKKGAHNIAVKLLSLGDASKNDVSDNGDTDKKQFSPVLGSRVILGLLPCNEVPDEILTDHQDRFRAIIVESTNPVHAYANSARMREAFRALEFSVVIDVAMTETARQADYVLPASSIYEKQECVFFPSEFPNNHFHLRQPIVDPLPGTLAEAEIHTRLVEALGGLDRRHVKTLRTALQFNKGMFAALFFALMAIKPKAIQAAPALLYRTLGPSLDKGRSAAAAPFWILSYQFIKKNRKYAQNAGFTGSLRTAAESMFTAVLNSPSGFIYSDSADDYSDSWNRVATENHRIRLHIPELFSHVTSLDPKQLIASEQFPFVLSAGQRRSETTNTIIRNTAWNTSGTGAGLRINPDDAHEQELAAEEIVRLVTIGGSVEVEIELATSQRPGTLALPNGLGVDYVAQDGASSCVGVALNELTTSSHKDQFAGTPWHKYVPARIEKLSGDISRIGMGDADRFVCSVKSSGSCLDTNR